MFSVMKLCIQTRTVGLWHSFINNMNHHGTIHQIRWPLMVHPGRAQPVLLPTRCLRVKPGGRRKMAPQYWWDKVPTSWPLIYESSLKYYIKSLYVTVSLMGISTGALVSLRWRNIVNKLTFWDGVGLGCVVTILLLALAAGYRFAQTVVIRIYQNPDSGQFMGVRRSCLGRLKQLSYYPQDVKLNVGGQITNKDIKHSIDVIIKGQRVYLTADSFASPVFYNVHFGNDDGPRDHRESFVSSPRF